MAEQAPVLSEDPAFADESAASAGKSSILAKIKVLLFVAIVIVVECLVACLYLPSASETAAMAKATLETNSQTATPPDQDQLLQEENLADQIEVDLGEFNVCVFQHLSGTTLRVDFHLFGTVGAEDEMEFLELMEDNRHRFRDQILATICSAEITDLTEPGLGLIKRKLLERTNKTLGKPLLRVVIFSDFSFIEQ